jgi:hypothetical protein
MRAGGARWDKDAEWFPGMQDEMLRFTGYSDATLDDQFDSAALLSLGFESMALLDEDTFLPPEDYDFKHGDHRVERNEVTGY